MSSDSQASSARRAAADAQQQASRAVEQVRDAASTASDFVSGLFDGIGDVFGGFKELDKTIKRYNPTFYRFVGDSFLKNVEWTDKPSKFLLLLIAIGVLQSIIPLFQWPLDFLSRMLAFLFLYNSGMEELKAGFSSSKNALVVKSLLVCFLVVSATQLIPTFLFDTYYHFGALWNFFMPVILFITPSGKKADDTIAVIISDTLFTSLSDVIQSIQPEVLHAENANIWALIACGIVGSLFWIGYLGATGSYITIWAFLAFSTVNTVGMPFISKDDSRSGYDDQMTVWHNLLAMWLWRYLVSTIESMAIPGVASVLGLILHHLPSYFLWMTAFMATMLLTKKTASKSKADTWYARWLIKGGIAPPKKKESSSPSQAPPRSSATDPRNSSSGTPNPPSRSTPSDGEPVRRSRPSGA